MSRSANSTKLGVYRGPLLKKLTSIHSFGNRISQIDCLIVKKYTPFYNGQSNYNMKTYDYLKEDIQAKTADEFQEMQENKHLIALNEREQQ